MKPETLQMMEMIAEDIEDRGLNSHERAFVYDFCYLLSKVPWGTKDEADELQNTLVALGIMEGED